MRICTTSLRYATCRGSFRAGCCRDPRPSRPWGREQHRVRMAECVSDRVVPVKMFQRILVASEASKRLVQDFRGKFARAMKAPFLIEVAPESFRTDD